MSDKTLALLYLGFDEAAQPTADQIKSAFKQSAMKLHPDGGGSDAQFRGLTVARDTLLQSTPKPTPAPTPKPPKQPSKENSKPTPNRKQLEKDIGQKLANLLYALHPYQRVSYLKIPLKSGAYAETTHNGHQYVTSLSPGNPNDDESPLLDELLRRLKHTLAIQKEYGMELAISDGEIEVQYLPWYTYSKMRLKKFFTNP
jgi:hypothetical protein